jgi:processive 1,2-diacylglycerol beta-glucosyltransferase
MSIDLPARVLLLSTSVGSGHVAAAAAIEQVLRATPGVTVRNQDALELASEALRVTYSDMYFRLVKDYPWLVGWWYDLQNEPFKGGQLRVTWEQLNAEPLIRLIRDFDPQITICTHFMPAGIIAQLLARDELDTKLAIVTTDLEFQGMWLSPLFHRYFVPLEETKVYLLSLGIPDEHITVSGIPVDQSFSQPLDRAAVQAAYALSDDIPTLLVSAGAAGITSAPKIVEQLMRMESSFNAVVVCGKNDLLRREIDAQVAPQAERFRVLGYTNELPQLMRVSTLFIGKPGGLTTAECMAARLPMVIVEPIPGQEERNSDHLLEAGAAIRCNQIPTLAYKLDTLLADPERLAQMRANTGRLARPDAAQVIANTLLSEDLAPHAIGRAEQQQIVSAARGLVTPERPAERARGLINLYQHRTGVLLGTVDEQQFGILAALLVRESEQDDDYYINQATVDMLQERGADAALLDMLRAALAGEGEAEVRWVRQ